MADKLPKSETLYYFTDGIPNNYDVKKVTELAQRSQFLDVNIFDVNQSDPKIKFVAGAVPELYKDRVIVDKPEPAPTKEKIQK